MVKCEQRIQDGLVSYKVYDLEESSLCADLEELTNGKWVAILRDMDVRPSKSGVLSNRYFDELEQAVVWSGTVVQGIEP